jgi:hypothetical protein
VSYPYQKKYRLSDIYRQYWGDYISSASRNLKLDAKHFKAVNYSMACRTSKMGYHYFSCEGCGHQHYLYHSCKHRFCGSCGSADTHRWAERQLSGLLDMKHYHVVFTLPSQLRGLCRRNEKLMYKLLFDAGQQALQGWFSSRHGLKCGIVSVLHTGGSDLKYHPHIHSIVSGGGLDTDTGELRELEGDFLVNHKHLGKEFRDAFIAGLTRLHGQKLLRPTARLLNGLGSLVEGLSDKDWIISIQPPLHDRRHIVRYVGRYTKRACLSEYRIRDVGDGSVEFSFKDYRNSEREGPVKEGVMRLGYEGFLDRLLQHVPEKGFHMVRYYGSYSPYYRRFVCGSAPEPEPDAESGGDGFEMHEEYWHDVYGGDALVCKGCDIRLTYRGQHFPRRSRLSGILEITEKKDIHDSS